MKSKIKVAVVDDSALVRQVLSEFIKSDPEMELVFAASDPIFALEKLKSNLEEVQARGGELFVFADLAAGFNGSQRIHYINVPSVPDCIAPIIYTIPLQLLSYHVAVLKGTDVDQPRNLAKSVTVE